MTEKGLKYLDDIIRAIELIEDFTRNIIYSGTLLKAFNKCYWRVMSWDENNTPSDWSDIAMFTIGPLGNTDWPAEWIGPPN